MIFLKHFRAGLVLCQCKPL